ncbi:alpha/beta fold hydrolase [Corynebacterium sp. A21]|uniref:alpha/beta fold hydrolase n=1 Tax=Corynebacterium sp. A21 TaxID=3457318 RepID=UPI003FD1F845
MPHHQFLQKAPSADGTEIGYLVQGVGPALVIVHGSVGDIAQWQSTVDELAKTFTVYIYDRRGRGSSGDNEDYSFTKESEDLRAILKVACPGARVLAHSYGALCALIDAMHNDVDNELILFEPPLNLDKLVAGPELPRYREAIAAGDNDTAMRIALLNMVDLPAEAVEAISQSPLWPQLLELAPTWTREFERIDALGFDHRRYRTLPGAKVHFLVGSNTTPMLKAATRFLSGHIEGAGLTTMPGLDHFSHVTAPVEFAAHVAKAAGH